MSDPTVEELKAQKAAADTALTDAAKAHAEKVSALLTLHDAPALLEGVAALIDGAPTEKMAQNLRNGVVSLRNGLRLIQAATRSTDV